MEEDTDDRVGSTRTHLVITGDDRCRHAGNPRKCVQRLVPCTFKCVRTACDSGNSLVSHYSLDSNLSLEF